VANLPCASVTAALVPCLTQRPLMRLASFSETASEATAGLTRPAVLMYRALLERSNAVAVAILMGVVVG
jgi:hypothetical protein